MTDRGRMAASVLTEGTASLFDTHRASSTAREAFGTGLECVGGIPRRLARRAEWVFGMGQADLASSRGIGLTTIDPTFRQALVEAAAWSKATGWPTRDQDMTIALDVLRRFAGRDVDLALEIAKALDQGEDREGLAHRVVLCRVAARLSGAIDPSANES